MMMARGGAAPSVFTEDELMSVLSEIDSNTREVLASRVDERMGGAAAVAWQTSVDVVADYRDIEGDAEFARLMDEFTPPDDSGSDETATSSSISPPPASSLMRASSPEHRNVFPAAATSPDPARKPTRKRRKHELDHLRAVAAALEAKLKGLSDTSSTNKSGNKYFWKRVSNQLVLEKQKSFGENARLREILREQVKVVKSLQRSLAKSPDLRKLGIIPEPRISGSHDSASPQKRFEGLFGDVSSSYNAVEFMFQQAGMPPPTVAGNRKVNMEMRSDGELPRMCLQIVESRKMPFEFLHIGDQTWQYLSRRDSAVNGGFEMTFQNQGDYLYGECKLHCDEGPVRLRGDVAVRRYVENQRLTFVWECAAVCHASLHRLQQKGWCMFEPMKEDLSNTTLSRMCVRITPTPIEGTDVSMSPKDIGSTTEFMLDNFERTVGLIFDQVLGNLTSGA